MSQSGDDLREGRIVRHGNLVQENGSSRREFLQATVAVLGSCLLPKCLRDGVDDKPPWYFIAINGDSWPVADPVAWSLENAHGPILRRASEGLRNLTTTDGDRVIRLVARRCALNLIELHPDRVVVHHWGCQGLGDLRPFFKEQGLSRREVEVVVLDRKREEAVKRTGDQYLYGEALSLDFPLGLFIAKWQRRFEREFDDWSAAPGTRSGYAWEGVEGNGIPWAALKSAWRRTVPTPCPNCDGPTLLTQLGYRQTGLLGREPSFVRVCGPCRRSSRDHSMWDVPGWMLANLDADVLPGYVVIWDRRVVLKPGDMRCPISDPVS